MASYFPLLCLFVAIIVDHICNGLGQQLIKIEVPKARWINLQEVVKTTDLDVVSRKYKEDGLELICAAWQDGLDVLKQAHIDYELLSADLTEVASQTRRTLEQPLPNGQIAFDRNLVYSEITAYLGKIQSQSTKNRKISVVTIGHSFQKRPIRMVKIKHRGASNIMFFDGGMHAREWLSVMTAMYLIDRLITNGEKFTTNQADWYIVPCLNPDGFVQSHEKDRLHRKNMNTSMCPKRCRQCGVNLNRNFGFKWGVADTSANPCSGTYGGPHAFSEPESRALATTLKKYARKIKLYVSLHSAAYCILYPWGYTAKPCDDWKDLEAAANVSIKSMEKYKLYNESYVAVNNGDGFYPSAGGSDDYAKGQLNIKYSYTMELQTGAGLYGFDPSPKETEHFVRQNYAGLTAMAAYINNRPRVLRSDFSNHKFTTRRKAQGSGTSMHVVRTILVCTAVLIRHVV